jgi:hypothetical protein
VKGTFTPKLSNMLGTPPKERRPFRGGAFGDYCRRNSFR